MLGDNCCTRDNDSRKREGNEAKGSKSTRDQSRNDPCRGMIKKNGETRIRHMDINNNLPIFLSNGSHFRLCVSV